MTDTLVADPLGMDTSAIEPDGIVLYGREAFAGMRAAGQLTARALDAMAAEVAPGMTTAEIDRLAYAFARDHGAYPATLLYKGYRHSTCTSLNHIVCHGIPNDKPLRDGDILNIDIALILDGWHGDSSRMYAVGRPSRKAERICEIAYESLERGIAAVRPGATTGDIGHAIQAYAEGERAGVVREFCGHGLGRHFHEAPNIMHFGQPGEGHRLRPGMIFTIEPMVNAGKPGVKVLSDGWTAVTRDRSLSAQFEHSVGVTEDGVEVFTRSPAGLGNPVAGTG